jgi:hypothetical protein
LKKQYPLDLAHDFIEKRFPECPVVIFTGSSKDALILSSDIDLVIFSPSIGQSYHDNFIDDDITFDVTLVPLYFYESTFFHCVNNVIEGTFLTMIITGNVIKDTENLAPSILNHAWTYYHIGYRGILPHKLTTLSNAIERRLEFLQRRPIGFDRCLLAYDVLDKFLEIYIWVHIGWSIVGKQRSSILYQVSPILHDRLYDTLKSGILTDNYEDFKQLVIQESNILANPTTENPKHWSNSLITSSNRIMFAISWGGDYFSFMKVFIMPLYKLFQYESFYWYVLPQQHWFELIFSNVTQQQSVEITSKIEVLKSTYQQLKDLQILLNTVPQIHFGGVDSFDFAEKIWSSLTTQISNQIANSTLQSNNDFRLYAAKYLICFGKGMGATHQQWFNFCIYLFDMWVIRAGDVERNLKYLHIADRLNNIEKGYEETYRKYNKQYHLLYDVLLQDWEVIEEDDWAVQLNKFRKEIIQSSHYQIPYLKQYLIQKKYPNINPMWLLYERYLEAIFAILNLRQQDIAFVVYIVKNLMSENHSKDNRVVHSSQ